MEQSSGVYDDISNLLVSGDHVLALPPKLLLVDDKQENLFTLKRILASVEGELHTATSGQEALGLMLEHDYALVLLDVQMPNMDGFETANLMREHAKTRDIPVIFVTALSTDQRYIKAGYATGAVDYLLKPIDSAILLSKVRVFLELAHKRFSLESAMAQLQRVSRRHQVILNCANEGILGINKTGHIMFSNPSAEALLHAQSSNLSGFHLARIFAAGSESSETLETVLELVATEGRHRSEDARFTRLDGTCFPVDYSCAAIVDGDHVYAGCVLVFNDITERKNVEQQLIRLARFDDLTGLANRTLFRDSLRKSMARAKRNGRLMGLLFFDLDRFKAVNDELGHGAGDELLREVARRLQQGVRESDLVARLGGDEFAIVIDEIESVANAGQIAEKLLHDLARPIVLEGRHVSTFTSIGIAIYEGDEDTPESVIKKADTAMYEAKRRGRNGYRYYNEGMTGEMSRRKSLETDLAAALDNELLEVHYQPQVSAQDATVVGFEALTRWPDRNRGLISPLEFIPVAEECGLIEKLGNFVIRTACLQLANWRDAGIVSTECRMAINISVMQLHSGLLVPVVRNCLEESGLQPSDIEIELTESVVMDDAAVAVEQLADLADLGVKIAVDDFGTGYSSLSYLQRLPIDTLKIDRTFISGIGDHPNSDVIVRSILALATSLGLNVVAEGVETEKQAAFLRDHGCHMLQGYYFGKPAPANAITITPPH